MEINADDNENLVVDAIHCPPRVNNAQNTQNVKEESANESKQQKETSSDSKENSTKKPKPRKSKKYSGSAHSTSMVKIENSKNFQLGPKFVINCNPVPMSGKASKNIPLTEEIERLFTNKTQLSRENLLFISEHIGEGWEDLARALGYSDGQIYQIRVDYINSGIKEVIYQVLYRWTCNKHKEATVGQLAKLLWDNKHEYVVQLLVKNNM